MHAWLRALPVMLAALLVASSMPGGTGEDISSPSRIPRFTDFTTPVLAPGESGRLNFTVENRYADTIHDLTLHAEIYRYATLEGSREVDLSFTSPPRMEYLGRDEGTSTSIALGSLAPGDRIALVFTIVTSENTPHGSLFDNAAYFVRFAIDFRYPDGNGSLSGYRMISRGYISDADWEAATRDGGLNLTLIRERYNASAIIPETSFTVREPIPLWPLFLLVGLAVLFGTLGTIFYLHEEHGRFPWLDKRLKQWSGKLRKARGLPQKREHKA